MEESIPIVWFLLILMEMVSMSLPVVILVSLLLSILLLKKSVEYFLSVIDLKNYIMYKLSTNNELLQNTLCSLQFSWLCKNKLIYANIIVYIISSIIYINN